MGLFNSNLINTLSKCKNPWKAIGFSALGAFATAAVTYGVKTGWNYVTSLFQTKAAKDVEDYKAEKAQQTETEKAKAEEDLKNIAKQVEANPLTVTPADAPKAPGSAGHVKLHNVPDKEAAMIMAIVADKMQTPLNELHFISIKEVK